LGSTEAEEPSLPLKGLGEEPKRVKDPLGGAMACNEAEGGEGDEERALARDFNCAERRPKDKEKQQQECVAFCSPF
jgi:hypothetical protein